MNPRAATLDEIPPSRIVSCVLAGIALVAGVWHAAFGLSLLVNLPLATHRFIVASGDSDFWLDIGFFRRTGAAIAVLALVLGISSVRAAGRTFASPHGSARRWLWLLALAVIVGALRASAEATVGALTAWRVASLLALCALYTLLWLLEREVRSAEP